MRGNRVGLWWKLGSLYVLTIVTLVRHLIDRFTHFSTIIGTPEEICNSFPRTKIGYRTWNTIANLSVEDTRLEMNKYFPRFPWKNGSIQNIFIGNYKNRIEPWYQEHFKDFPDPSYGWTGIKGSPDDLIWGTLYTQRLIWENQFPMSCDNKEFITAELTDWGIGAVIKHISRLLGWGMRGGKILTFTDHRWIWTKGAFCKNDPTYTCFFHPITNCTLDGVKPKKIIVAINNNFKGYLKNTAGSTMREKKLVPYEIRYMLSISPLAFTGLSRIAYWEMQAMAFLCRLNERTVQWIKTHHVKDASELDSIDVNMHIRHGDKSSEMQLVNTSSFINILKIIKHTFNKRRLKVFISTEDESAITEMAKAKKWIKVKSLVHERINGGFFEFQEKANEIALISFANLYANMRPRHEIGTVMSNWNRMIHWLRLTVGYKFNTLYFEAGSWVGNCYTAAQCQCQKYNGEMNRL